MSIERIYSPTAATTAANTLQQVLEKYEAVPILLLVSGGSWLSVLDLLPPQLCSYQLTLGMLDERYDTNPAHNNFSQLMRTTFFATAKTCGLDVIDTRVQPAETAEALALRFEETIRAWQADNPEGVIVVTFGMGSDGHTAGIMPGYVATLSADAAYVQSYSVPETVNPFPDRVTVTPHFLTTQVTEAVAYVSGEHKCATLAAVMQASRTVEEAPAQLWHDIPVVTVVTDCP